MRYVLDTNILLFYIRGGAAREFVEHHYAPFDAENEAIISVVTVAEIMVLASINNWGSAKMKLLQQLIDGVTIVEVKFRDLIDCYLEIEQYNRNLHPDKRRSGSHVKMGKNDIWIAATAMVTNAKLLTADLDFAHLDDTLIDVTVVRL